LKGRWIAGAQSSPQVLGRLKRSVLITSTGASTRIEGAKLTDEDVEKLMCGIDIEMVAKLFLLQFYLFGCVIVRLRKMLFAVAGLRPQNILLVFLASLENLKFRYEIVLQPSHSKIHQSRQARS